MNVSNIPNSSASEPTPGPEGPTGGDAAAPPDPVSRLAPLTGRDTEVSLLKDRWEQAKEGMGQVVLLIGEPGLGKSRLVSTIKQIVQSEAEALAGESPAARVIEWRCSQRFQNTSLYPACNFFDRLLGFGREQSPGEQFDRLARHLEEYELARPDMVSLFAALLLLPPDERITPHGLSPIREREETFRALREWLSACARRQPILFVVEDLHWMDASTLEFLGQFVAEGLQDRVLTVLTFRPEFKTPWPAVAHQTSLALNRLTRRQVGELMRKNAEGPLPEPLVEQIYNSTRGVPLFVEELTMMLRDPRAPQRASESRADMPATLHDLIIARLDRTTNDRDIAQLAATLGREFSHELIAAAATVSESELRGEIDKLVQAEILFQKGRPPRCTYVFKHSLLEDALRDSMAKSKRQQFHRQIAEALETRFPDTAAALPELLAHHLTEADLIDKAVTRWLLAGLKAREHFANIESISHLSRGLELLRTLEESPERDARELEFFNPLGTVFIAARGYGAPEVGPIFARARELCAKIGEPTALFAIMWGTWVWQAVRGDLRLCMELADEALALAERVGEPGMLMEGLFPPAVTLTFRGDFRAAHAHSARALADYDDRERTRAWAAITGEDSGVAHRCYLAVTLWHLGKADEALHCSAEAVAIAREIAQPFTLAFALEHRAWLCNQCRLAPEARAAAEEEITISTEQGFAYWLASATLFKADSLVLQGHYQEAIPLILKGIKDLRATGAGLDLTLHFGFLAEAYTGVDKFSDAAKALDEGLATAEKTDERFYEAELHRLRGELFLAESPGHPQAEAAFGNAVEIARRQQSKAMELRATTSLARLWHAQGRHAEARTALAAVHNTFTQGLTTPDLRDAKVLLEVLGNQRMRHDFAAGVKYVLGCIPPPIDGPVSVDWRYIPSSSLGGDTIGYHWIDPDHLALYLIDVTGHGLDSALLSVTITNVLRSSSLSGTDMRQPGKVLATLNDAFPGDQHGQKFFTIWYGVYEQSSRLLTWSGGGHHPSLLLAPGESQPTLLPSPGMMMGVARGAEFPSESCRVIPGSRLLIFSDGVFEIIRGGRVVWNLEACIAHLAKESSRGGAILDELLNHVRQLRGSHELEDDFSILQACFQQDRAR